MLVLKKFVLKRQCKGGVSYERSTSTGWDTQGRVHPDVGRQARKMGRQWPPLRGLGDLSPQGISRRSESAVCVAVQRLVWADHSTLRRRRQDMAPTRHTPGEPTTTPDGMPKGESNKFVYDTSSETGKPLTTHQWYDGTPHPWEFKRVWHLEPSLNDPDTVYAGVEDAALFRSTDGGQTWQELPGLRGHGTGPSWQPGAGGMCLHTILLDPSNPNRIFIAISAAGAFRTDDAGKTWQPINRGLHSQYIPDPTAEVGHCVHRIAMHRSRPGVLFMQKHWDVMRSDDAGESWHEISGNLPTDFGFAIDVHAHEPETIYVVPIKSDSEHFPPEGKLRVYRSRTGGNEWEALTKGLPQSDCYVNVLRDAMAVDSLDTCGVYFGTTGGQVYASADAGDNWAPIVRDLPAVVSVEVQTLP